jgi:competence protein ComFC
MRISSRIPRALLSASRRVGLTVLSLLYPPHCANCLGDTEAGEHLCDRCAAEAPRIREPFCQQCSQPFAGAISGDFTCSNCEDRAFHFTCAISRYRSRGVVKEFIHRFKYERHFYLRHQLTTWLLEAMDDPRLAIDFPDLLVPVPLHRARYREREFNQSAVLATLLSRRIGIPVGDCLQRTRYTTTQTRLNRAERMENLRGAFCVRQTPPVSDRHLLLIDDVLTTGSTVDECSRVLLEAGAASVRVLTAARA